MNKWEVVMMFAIVLGAFSLFISLAEDPDIAKYRLLYSVLAGLSVALFYYAKIRLDEELIDEIQTEYKIEEQMTGRREEVPVQIINKNTVKRVVEREA